MTTLWYKKPRSSSCAMRQPYTFYGIGKYLLYTTDRFYDHYQ
jgi:hypothetical protein